MKELIDKSLLINNTYRFTSKIFNDEIYIYYFEKKFKAVSGFCPHFGGPLNFKNNNLYCSWHGWMFDCIKLNCINHKINIKLKKYSVSEKNKFLEINNDY